MPKSTDVENVDDEIENRVRKFLKQVAIDFSGELAKEMPVDRGRLRQSRQVIETKDGVNVAINAKYASAVNFGTRPYTPPLEPILNWAERKLGAREIGYAVHNKIQSEGITGQHYIEDATENLKKRYR